MMTTQKAVFPAVNARKVTPIMGDTLQADDARIAQDLLANDADWLDPAPVRQAESMLAHWLGMPAAFGFMGGRAALYAIVEALGIGEGDEVIVPGFTCQVVINGFAYHGAHCVYADIETDTLGLDVNRFIEKITPRTRAVLLQHSFGVPARDTLAIVEAARKAGLVVIEDVAHGLGGTLEGRKLGTFGDVAFFSSERTKMINTIHGGFAASSNPEILSRLRKVYCRAPLPPRNKIAGLLNTLLYCYYTKVHEDRNNLMAMARERYGARLIPQMTEFEYTGRFESVYRCKMPGAVGQLAVNQLDKFEAFIPLRQQAADKWQKWAAAQGYRVLSPAADSYCTWLRYPVFVPEALKNDTAWIEKDLAMEAGVWFTTPCHPTMKAIADIPNGWRASQTVINLPTGLWVK